MFIDDFMTFVRLFRCLHIWNPRLVYLYEKFKIN